MTFGTTKKSVILRRDDLLKEVQFIRNILRQYKQRVTVKNRWLLNRSDRMGMFDCICFHFSISSYNLLNVYWRFYIKNPTFNIDSHVFPDSINTNFQWFGKKIIGNITDIHPRTILPFRSCRLGTVSIYITKNWYSEFD